MLAWLVSIDIVEMNHRHKPKKKKQFQKIQNKVHEEDLKTYFWKDEQFSKRKTHDFWKSFTLKLRFTLFF